MSSLWKAEAWRFKSRLKNSHALPRHPASANPAQDTAHRADGDKTQRWVTEALFTIGNKHMPFSQ